MPTFLINSENYVDTCDLELFAIQNQTSKLPEYFTNFGIPDQTYYYIKYKEEKLKVFLQTISNSTVILYNPIEPIIEYSIDFFKNILQELENNNIKLEIWLGNFDEKYNNYLNSLHDNISVINWNKLVLYLSYNLYKSNDIQNQCYDKLYINLNNKSRYHRCLLVDQLAKHNLMDYGNISWLNKQDLDTVKHFNFQYFNNATKILDTDEILSNHPIISRYISTSFINLYGEFTESEIEVIDISEKTWLSLLYKKPFLAVASKGFYNQLTKLGFDLYDEIFDYEFDNRPKLEDRISGVVDNLISLKDLNYEELYDKIAGKIEYNQKILFNLLNDKDELMEKWYSNTVQDKETNLIVSKFKHNFKGLNNEIKKKQ